MRTQHDKIAQVCRMWLTNADDAIVTDYPGDIYISIETEWTEIPIRSGATSLKEKGDGGAFVTQEFETEVTGLVEKLDSLCKEWQGQRVLLRLGYTNGETKVVGNGDIPVQLSFEKNGSPHVYKITCKRNSPEFAKFLR